MQHSLGGATHLRFGINRPCCNVMNYTYSLATLKKDQEPESIDITHHLAEEKRGKLNGLPLVSKNLWHVHRFNM